MPRISEQHREARRANILNAARGLFETNGFHATSMDDIVEAAGMSAGGVYRYFPGKDAIIAAIAEDVVGRLTATVNALLAGGEVPPLNQALRQLIVQVDVLADGPGRLALSVWGEAQRDPHLARIASAAGASMRSVISDLLHGACRTGQLPAGTDVEALSHVVFSMIAGYLLQRRILGGIDPGKYADAIGGLLRP